MIKLEKIRARPFSSSAGTARSPMLQRQCACGGKSSSGGECSECKKQKTLQRQTSGTAQNAVAPPIVNEVLRSPGQPLDAETRAYMEPRFGHDFSKVRIHADAQANESARSVNAQAYTVGRRIAFADGQYSPGTSEGRHILAHELAHVVQQRGTADRPPEPVSIGSPESAAEREASAVASGIATGSGPVSTHESSLSATLCRIGGITIPTGIRALDATEEAILRPVFGGSLDYSAIHLSDAVGGGARPYTVATSQSFQVINIGPSAYKTPGSNPSLLRHESTHCWQAQHDSDATAYMKNSIASQAAAAVAGASAYCYVPGKPFWNYGAEQIAEQVENGEAPIISHIASVAAGAVDPLNTLSLTIPHWEKKGAPGVKC